MKKLFTILLLSLTTLSFAQEKIALVIGNGAYTEGAPLKNALNDANDMADVLKSLGFTVDKLLNGNLSQMESSVVRLKNRLSASRNSYGFLFYAGHGVQMDGVNYLLPVDANIPDRNFLRDRAVSVQAVLDMINDAGNALNIVVLDACRDLPMAWSRSAERGLTVVTTQPADSIIVYATAAGRTASDGDGRNGLFTGYLLNNLKTPGLDVSEVIRRTGADVARASNGNQRPATYFSFYDIAYLGTRPENSVQVQPAPAPAPVVAPMAPPPENPVSGNMVKINGGTFNMGSPPNERGRNGDETQYRVALSPFQIGKYEVTQKEYEEVMGMNPSSTRGPNLPVDMLSWYDAVLYCNKRSEKEALVPAYTINGDNVSWNRDANGYRLPTEAEWEYCCRAGTSTPYYSGSSVDNAGWYSVNSGNRSHPVGEKQPNAWGLYDMHGNVWEWCWDRYGTYSGEAQTDPQGATTGTNRVARGGGWFHSVQFLRSACRYSLTPISRGNYLGFRVVRSVN